MEYVTTETSNQFVQAGFGEGTYGPETLGIIFKPAKWQEKKGLPGSTYHYAVPTNIYQRMMAAKDIDAYFNDTIKAHPEQYPYTKVEADPTSASTPARTADAATRVSIQSNGAGSTTDDTPAPVTSLAVIDTLTPEVIFTPGNVDAILVKLREQVLAMAKGLDPSTPAKQKRIRDVKGLVASQRIFVEKARKGYVADLVAKKGLTDKVSNAIQGRLSDIESEILEVTGYAAWEQGEKEFESRMTGLQNRLANMGKEMHLYSSCAAIEAAIKELEEFDTSATREHKQGIETVIDNSLRVLKPELARRQEADANARELAELRRKQAEREEADRKAEEQRQEQARIDAAVQTKLDAALEAAKAATRQEVIAEMALPTASGLDARLIESDEFKPFDYPVVGPDAKGFHSPAAVQAAQEYTVVERRQKIMDEAAEALMGLALTRTEAMRVVSAIAYGEIPHIDITF